MAAGLLKYVRPLSGHKALKCFKGSLSYLRQFLATESRLKMMKIVFYVSLIALNEIWSVDRIWETFFLKNHTQNVMGKLFSNPFLKKIKIEHISGSIAESYIQFAIIVQQVEGYLKI